jgi:hypothetical protein
VSARNAFAVNFASKTDIDAIEAQLLTAQGMDDKIRKARLKYEAADSNIETSKADLRGLKRDVEREEAKQRAARTKAIHMTIQAWGLAPAKLSGTSVMRWTKGRTITWLPVAGKIEDRQVESPKGKLGLSKKPSEPADAVTYPDGVTYISESRFLRGPGYLASVLLHERTHFEQFTTEGTGNVLSRAQRQEQALQAEVDNTKYFYDPVKDKDLINETKNALRKEKQKVLLEKGLLGRLRRLLPADGKPDSSESIVHTNAELADISGLVAQARAQADIARREREEREALTRAAAETADKMLRDAENNHPAELLPTRPGEDPPGYVRAVPTQPGRGAIALNPTRIPYSQLQFKDIASRACSAPPKTVDRQLAAVDWEQFQKEPNIELYADGISPCERRVFMKLVELGRMWRPGVVIGADAVRAAAVEPGSGSNSGGFNDGPPGKGGGCFKGDDPFGCQPR